LHLVAEQHAAGREARRLAHQARQSGAVEDVVTQHQRHRVRAHELSTDNEGFGQAVGGCLLGVREAHAQLFTGAEQPCEQRQVLGRGNNQDFRDSREHQYAERVKDHRLVIDRQELLGDHARERIQTRSAATSQDDALHSEGRNNPSGGGGANLSDALPEAPLGPTFRSP
jgi:hypothetical protein